MNQNQAKHELSVREYAIAVREQTANEFDQANAALLDQTLQDIGKILSLKSVIVLKGCGMGTGARFQAFALTKTAMDVLVSALHMARQRASVETFALLRVALEAACTSRHIYNDEDAYKRYLLGEYKSTGSITPVKADIPIIGELWGAFSKACVHTNHCCFGPQYSTDGDGTIASTVDLIFGKIRPSVFQQDAIMLTSVSLVAMILLKILEKNISDGIPDKSGWMHVVGSHLDYCHNTDARISHYYQAFLEFAQEDADIGNIDAQRRSS